MDELPHGHESTYMVEEAKMLLLDLDVRERRT
jgi:hypothetical protein